MRTTSKVNYRYGHAGKVSPLRLVAGAIVIVVVGATFALVLNGCDLSGLDDDPLDTPSEYTSLDIRFRHESGDPLASHVGTVSPRLVARTTGAEVGFYLGFKGTQSGCLVAGHSDRDDATMSFRLSAVARDGETMLG